MIKQKTIKKFKFDMNHIKKYKVRYLFVLPAFIWFTIFCYVPMFGIIISTKDYNFAGGIFNSPISNPWYKWFDLFLNNPTFWSMIKNTITISIIKLITGFPAPIILALMINEVKNKHYKKAVQTISYLPFFISWVIVATMMTELFTPYNGQGPINKVIQVLTGANEPEFYMGKSYAFYPIIILTNIWKGVGWNSIIYLAAITSINSELYEAAKLDGAGRICCIFKITLPLIKNTILLLFILSLGSLMSAGYDQVYVFKHPGNYVFSNVLDIYIIETGLNKGRYEIATVANLFQSIISLILVVTGNFILRKKSEVSLW